MAAYLAGLEALTAIGSAINLRHYELGWHATATIGTVAAAVAGARLLRLDAERAGAALGLAASQAGGVRRNFGSMAKPLHAGLAARAGVLAALLAEQGLTAGDDGARGRARLVRPRRRAGRVGRGRRAGGARRRLRPGRRGTRDQALRLVRRHARADRGGARTAQRRRLRGSSASTRGRTRWRGRSPPTTSRPTGCSRSSASSTASPSRCSTAAPTSTSSPTPEPATRRSSRCAAEPRSRRTRRSAWPGT